MRKLLLLIVFLSAFFFAGTHIASAQSCDVPTPTAPACNQSCTPGGVACPQSCPNCVAGGSGYTCQSTPACNSTCETDFNCATARDGCTACVGGRCKTPPACGTPCSSPLDCSNALNGCNACVGGTCKAPPACGASCTSNQQCAGALNGCVVCNPNTHVCEGAPQPTKPAEACNVTCTRDSDCAAGTRDGCTVCLSNSNGTKTCQQPPACGSACNRNDSNACNNAKDPNGNACNDCRPNSSGQTVCQPPGACNVACTKDADCAAGSRDGCTSCQGGVCKPPPACNVACSKDADCAGARDGCTACVAGSNGTKTCKPPAACNVSCTRDSDCAAGTRDGCTSCVTNSNGTKSCQKPPSCGAPCNKNDANACAGVKNPAGQNCNDCRANSGGQTVCQPPVACNSTCVKDDDCNAGDAKAQGCVLCVANSNGTKTCQKPPACGAACTSDKQCANATNGCVQCNSTTQKCQTPSTTCGTCDGSDISGPITPGKEVTFTFYEKIDGPGLDMNKIKSKTVRVVLTKGNDPANAAIVAQAPSLPVEIVTQTATSVRYKVTWKVKIPDNIEKGVAYKVASIDNDSHCMQNGITYNTNQNSERIVLGETAPQPQGNIFSQIFSFFASLFGRGTSTQQQGQITTPTPRITIVPTQNPLKIGTFNPLATPTPITADVVKSCHLIKFTF